MKKKIIFIVLSIILIIAIVTAVIIGISISKDKKEYEENSVESKWNDTYYAYLKNAINEEDSQSLESEYGLSKDMKDGKIQFCKVEDEENPKMILTYKRGDNTAVNVYRINSEGKVDKKCYNNKAVLRYLYDLETQSYGWFICEVDEDNQVYISMRYAGSQDEEQNTIKIENKEATVTLDDNKNVTITEFDKKFIKPEIEQINSFDFSLDMKEEDLEKELKELVENIQELKELVSEEEKQNISNKEKELNDIIKLLSELAQKNKEIVGTWGLNNNVRSNSSDNVSLNTLFGSSLKLANNELVLNEDGSFSLYIGAAYNTTGKYKFENNIVSVYNIKDAEIKNAEALKQLEKDLKFEYIKYNNHEFLKLQILGILENETYIFFEKRTNGNQGIMTDAVPDVKFKTTGNTSETTNSKQDNNVANENQSVTSANNQSSTSQNASNNDQKTTSESNQSSVNQSTSNASSKITVGGHTLNYGTYAGTERQFDVGNIITYDATIKLNPDGTYVYQTTNQSSGRNKSGKYKVGDMYGSQGIIFDNGQWFLTVYGDDIMMEPAGSSTMYIYQGN